MIETILEWANDSFVNEAMTNIFWLWPFMENLHFLGLSVMFGALLVVDLRVLGVAPSIPMAGAMKLIPLVLMAFTVNLLTGLTFVAAAPFSYTSNLAFQWKVGLMFLAGINALWFWIGEHGRLMLLADGEQADFPAKVIAALSLVIWIAVIVLGRLIPYF